MSIENRAIELAASYFRQGGYEVEDVSHRRGHNGYDFVVTRGDERLLIEVKGCSREWQIPDPYITEFDGEPLRLVADYLCVVYLLPRHKPSICVIPREAIPAEYVTLKQGYRISSRLKKRCTLERYMHRLDVDRD